MDMLGLVSRIDKRLQEVGLTHTEASRQATGSADTIRNWRRAAAEGKTTGATQDKLEAVAQVLHTKFLWLTTGNGPEEAGAADEATSIPVYADVPAGKMMATEGIAKAEDIRSHVTISGLGKGNWAALIVNGNSMNKVAPDGSMIVFNRADQRPVDNGFFVFEHPETGEATFKRFGAGKPPRLRPYSYDDYDPIMVTEDIVIVGRVKKVLVDL
jgi:SOS-response transcriptional repressor LexA